MKIYLSGPTGPDSLPKFEVAARRLVEVGYGLVLMPHGKDLADHVADIADADGLVLLPGWETDPASLIEADLARGFGLPVLPFGEALRIGRAAGTRSARRMIAVFALAAIAVAPHLDALTAGTVALAS